MRNQILVVILIHLALVCADKKEEQEEYVQIRGDYGTQSDDHEQKSNDQGVQEFQKKQDSNGYHNLNYRQQLGFHSEQSGNHVQQNNGAIQHSYGQDKPLHYPEQAAHIYGRPQHKKRPAIEQPDLNSIQGSDAHEGHQSVKIQYVPKLEQQYAQFVNHKQINNLAHQEQAGLENAVQNNKYAYYAQQLEAGQSILQGQNVHQQQYNHAEEQNAVQGHQLQDVKYVTYVEQPEQSGIQENVAYNVPQNIYHVPAHEHNVQQQEEETYGSHQQGQQFVSSQLIDNSAYDLYKNKQIVELSQNPSQVYSAHEIRKNKHQGQRGHQNNIQGNYLYNFKQAPKGAPIRPQALHGNNAYNQNNYIQYVVQSAQKLLQGSKHITPYPNFNAQINNAHPGNQFKEHKQPSQVNYLTKPGTVVPYPQQYPVQVQLDNKIPISVPYTGKVPVNRPHTVNVQKPYPINIEKPYPVPYPVKVPVSVPYEVPVSVTVPQIMPYPIHKPVQYSSPLFVPFEELIPAHGQNQHYQQLPQQQFRNNYSNGGHKNIQSILSQQQGSSGASQSQNNGYNGRH